MEKDEKYYIDLITRYLSGESANADISELSEWIKQSENNKQIFNDHYKTWLAIEQNHIETALNIEEEWNKVKEKTISAHSENTQIIVPEFSLKLWNKMSLRFLRIAALFVLIALSAFFAYQWFEKPSIEMIQAQNKNLEQYLSDGSIVTLKAGSTLAYPDKFKKDERKVTLQGKAYFEVQHDAQRPFIIEAGNVLVEVLGTSFYINASEPNGNVEIVLTNGKLAVSYKNNPDEKVILSPGEKAVFSEKQKTLTKNINNDNNYIAWKTGIIKFNNTPLKEIVSTLNNVYHSDIRLIDENIADSKINVTFENQNLDAVLNVLRATLDLKIVRKGKVIEISDNAQKK